MPHDLPNQPQCGLRLLEPGGSFRVPGDGRQCRLPLRFAHATRLRAAAAERLESGRLSEQVSSLYSTTRPASRSAASTYWTRAGLRYTRVKRTHITNQMKRVQGDESPWRRFGGAQPPTDSPRKTLQSQYVHAKVHLHRAAAPVLRVPPFSAFPRPFVLRRDRHKETRKPEVNQQSRITTRHPRTHEWRSRPTAEQERNIPQAVLFGAQAANSRRDRT